MSAGSVMVGVDSTAGEQVPLVEGRLAVGPRRVGDQVAHQSVEPALHPRRHRQCRFDLEPDVDERAGLAFLDEVRRRGRGELTVESHSPHVEFAHALEAERPAAEDGRPAVGTERRPRGAVLAGAVHPAVGERHVDLHGVGVRVLRERLDADPGQTRCAGVVEHPEARRVAHHRTEVDVVAAVSGPTGAKDDCPRHGRRPVFDVEPAEVGAVEAIAETADHVGVELEDRLQHVGRVAVPRSRCSR
jgi:hypothetical protein